MHLIVALAVGTAVALAVLIVIAFARGISTVCEEEVYTDDLGLTERPYTGENQ